MKLSSREIVGIILWWAEGSKSRQDKRWKNTKTYPIEVTNTNPLIIQSFLDFLRYDLQVSEQRLRVQIQIHEGDDQEQIEDFWSNLTNIPIANFHKTIIRPTGNKVGKSRGTCKIRFTDKMVYQKLEDLLRQVLIETHKDPSKLIIL